MYRCLSEMKRWVVRKLSCSVFIGLVIVLIIGMVCVVPYIDTHTYFKYNFPVEVPSLSYPPNSPSSRQSTLRRGSDARQQQSLSSPLTATTTITPSSGSEGSVRFETLNGTQMWLYSAFFHDGGSPMIRMVGMANRYPTAPRALCHLETVDGVHLMTSKAKLTWFSDSHKLNITSCELRCKTESFHRPYFVKVSSVASPDIVTNRIRILYASPRVRNFTVCLSPIHSNYSNGWQLVQTIELNRLLGAEHFFVYNVSMSSEVEIILRAYQLKGLVTFIQWPVHGIRTWYFGQVTAISDCVYRNRNLSRFVIVTDADEVIVPMFHSNWWDMLQDLSTNASLRDLDFKDEKTFSLNLRQRYEGHETITNPGEGNDEITTFDFPNVQTRNSVITGDQPRINLATATDFQLNETQFHSSNIDSPFEATQKKRFDHIGSFLFRCAFYITKDLPSKEMPLKNISFNTFGGLSTKEIAFLRRLPSSSLLDLFRSESPFVHGQRSKYIVRPETVDKIAIHNIKRQDKDIQTVFVKKEVALLHHFRVRNARSCNTMDISILRFKDKLLEALQRAIENFPFLLATP